MIENNPIYAVLPVFIERQCGGWLAVTPHGWPVGIGVTADTKANAEQKFKDELVRWSKIKKRFD
jgi:hypothetical protein